jgi:CRP-like cAMP-binding protein
MDTDLLLANIKKFVKLTPEDELEIIAGITSRSFKRGQFLSKEGEINRFTNFITQGSARVYYINQDGEEHVVQLGIRDWWISDYNSFTMQQPGLLYCEALENTEILAFSHDYLQVLFDKVPMMERFYRLMIQKAYASFQKRILQTLSMDAEQRYIAFRDAHPLMDQQLSQKDIASYLGMSAEFLSKIKKRLVLKAQKKYNPNQ